MPYSFLAFGLTLLFTRNVTKAVSVLMVDYSCAIKLYTPIAVIAAIKEAADDDVTVKGGKYLEEYALADSIVFDKTGTLTNAEPVLEKVIALGDYSEAETLKIAACLIPTLDSFISVKIAGVLFVHFAIANALAL